MGCIYRIYRRSDGKSYIGQTVNDAYNARIHRHFGDHCENVYLQRSIAKHGRDAFDWEILEDGLLDFLLTEREQYWMDHYDSLIPNGYNLREAGSHGHLTPEARQRISDAQKGRVLSRETRQKISDAHKGKSRPSPSKATREKMSKTRKGRKHSPEHSRKIAEALRGKPLSEAHKKRISEAHKGKKRKPHSAETRKKLSDAAKRRRKSTP